VIRGVGAALPVVLEVDGESHYFENSGRSTGKSTLKKRLLQGEVRRTEADQPVHP
jgi:hypothetical protein